MSIFIYKLYCDDSPEVYVGSTENMKIRMTGHKTKCNAGYNWNVYKCIRANGGWDNWKHQVIEECSSELRAETEDKWIVKHGTLNMRRGVFVGHVIYNKKYKDDNKEEIKNYGKKYYNDNKEHLSEKNPCLFCDKLISNNNMSRHINTQHSLGISN